MSAPTDFMGESKRDRIIGWIIITVFGICMVLFFVGFLIQSLKCNIT